MTTCKCERPAPLQTQVSRYICASCSEEIAGPDPRDVEIARLKAEVGSKNATIEATRRHVDRLRRALADGPANLRWRGPMSGEEAARNVERAQAAAMKEEP